MLRVRICALVAALTVATAAQAEVFQYNFVLDGSQEVPPVDTPGTGVGNVVLDTSTNALSWTISFQNLLAPVTAAHFHAPAAPGSNASVILGIAGSGASSPITGSATISDTFESHLLNGLTYVNIHTQSKPTGEIRGQVTPEPTTLAMLGLGALAMTRRRR